MPIWSCSLWRTFLLLACTGAVAAPFAGQAQQSAATREHASEVSPLSVFPTIAAESLDRTSILLPSQLEGTENLLLLSWARDQGPQLDTWTAVSQAMQHSDAGFRVYKMLVSAPENILYRWWETASLRADETDPELLHWNIPLYTDKTALRRSLGLENDEHSVAALLVDKAGHVLWKAEGPSTASTRAALLAAAVAKP